MGISMLNIIMRFMCRLHNGQQIDHNCKHMALGINMLSSNFLVHTELLNHDTWCWYTR